MWDFHLHVHCWGSGTPALGVAAEESAYAYDPLDQQFTNKNSRAAGAFTRTPCYFDS
jgi:hypothetical protein